MIIFFVSWFNNSELLLVSKLFVFMNYGNVSLVTGATLWPLEITRKGQISICIFFDIKGEGFLSKLNLM